MKSRLLLALAAAALGTVAAQAAPFKPEYTPEGSKWIVHMDFEKMKATKIGAAFVDQLQAKEGQKWEALKVLFNFDPAKDILGFTLYGTERDSNLAAMTVTVKLAEPVEKYRERLRVAGGQPEVVYGPQRIYSLQPGAGDQGGNKAWACLFNDKLLLIAKDQGKLKEAIDVVAGKKPHLAAAGESLWYPVASQPCVFMAGTDLNATQNAQPGAPANDPGQVLMQRTRGGTLSLDEVGDKVKLQVRLTTDTAESASQLMMIAQGLLTMAAIQAPPPAQPDAAAAPVSPEDMGKQLMAKLAKAAQVKAEGTTVSLSLDYEAAPIVQVIRDALPGAPQPPAAPADNPAPAETAAPAPAK